jgi:exonuclease I
LLLTDRFRTRIGEAISNRYPPTQPSVFVEQQIYDGFSRRPDEFLMQRFHQVSWEQRAGILEQIEDPRIRELGYRIIYAERPNCLSDVKRAALDAWQGRRLQSNIEVPWLTIAAALDEIEKLLKDDSRNVELFSEVSDWLRALTSLQSSLGGSPS